jgi:hypothetical protein
VLVGVSNTIILMRMKNFFSLFSLLITVSIRIYAQSLTDSNLPILIIKTDGNAEIQDQPRIFATMKIIYAGEGQRNYVSDENEPSVLNYNGRIEIEIRGSSSQFLSKKQYSLTTLLSDNTSKNNVSLLGMPEENDWVLNGLAFDASYIRDYLSYTLSRNIGNYAPRTKYCEVIINGDYRGLYLLQEKIKADDNRVDIVKIATKDNTLPDLSGGYITKADKFTGEDPAAWTVSSYLGSNDVSFIHEMPKPSAITATQNNYIKSRFEKLQSTVSNSSITEGFPSVIDIPSFIDFMLINELAANVDAYQFSTYFHKDKNGKLRAGPLWDLNLTYGNDLFFWGLDRSKTYLWQFDNGDNVGARFWKDLFNNSVYKCYLSKRWNQLTKNGAQLHLASIETLIDETVENISEAIVREQEKWPTGSDHSSDISGIKTFLADRITWMNSSMGSFASCNNIQTPPLVITRIMYQPNTSSDFPDSNDQEFIEILNNGNESVNLAGFYFSGTGFVYQFPSFYTLAPQGVLQLANKSETFKQRFGYSPFGEFVHNLSNSGQKLTLADAYGNVIDEVTYSNEEPWPNVADNGYHLKLISPDLDNNLPSSWTASDEQIETNVEVVGIEEANIAEINIYPAPVDNGLTVSASSIISGLQLFDLQGRLLQTFNAGASTITVDLNRYSQGMYLLTVIANDRSVTRKIIKK